MLSLILNLVTTLRRTGTPTPGPARTPANGLTWKEQPITWKGEVLTWK